MLRFPILVLALLAVAPAVATDTLPPLGGASPSDIALRLRDASDAADPVALAALLTTQARSEMCAAMTLGSLMLVGADEDADQEVRDARRAELDRILHQHGLDGLLQEAPADEPFAAFEGLDHLGYLREIVRFLSLHFPEESAFPAPGSDSSLVGAPVVEGDRGTLAVGSETYGLERIGDRWYLSPPTPAAPGTSADN